jgi:trimeric autotransporter adhesin
MPRLLCVYGALTFLASASALGQPCQPGWQPFPLVSTHSPVRAALEITDRSNTSLYVATTGYSNAASPSSAVLRWTGLGWTEVGGRLIGTATDLAVFDEGQGDRLYVSGRLAREGIAENIAVMRLDGGDWIPLTPSSQDSTVTALLVHDDGAGPALYAAGSFGNAAGPPTYGVRRWGTASWETVGGWFDAAPMALCAFDEGLRPRLFAGGFFGMAAGVNARRIARWDGSSWSPVGSGLSGSTPAPVVATMAVHDTRLCVGGTFTSAGSAQARHVAQWDGHEWSAMGSGFAVLTANEGIAVEALAVFDSGLGLELYAGGWFTRTYGSPVPDVSRMARWDGTAWLACGTGVNGAVRSLSVVSALGNPVLLTGGDFATAGGRTAPWLASWSGDEWRRVGEGIIGGIVTLNRLDNGRVPMLYLGGGFSAVGRIDAHNLARWDGSQFSEVGGGVVSDSITSATIFDTAVHREGIQEVLVVAGSFDRAGSLAAKNVAAWDGTAWRALGPGLGTGATTGAVMCVASHDANTGPEVYAGYFSASPGAIQNGVYRWSQGAWQLVGAVTGGQSSSSQVTDLYSYDDGSGPALFATGSFTHINGVMVNKLARLRSGGWEPVGGGISSGDGTPIVFAAYAEQGHNLLLLGGSFSTISGVPARSLAAWDGTGWSEFHGGVASSGLMRHVGSIAHADDGAGPALFISGHFDSAGGVAANRAARWDGQSWSPLGLGLSGAAALFGFDDGSGPSVFAGGNFTSAGGQNSQSLAKWTQCRACYANCDNSSSNPVLGPTDFLCFMTRYIAGDPYANCDASTIAPQLNVQDFTCFLQRYAQGCP